MRPDISLINERTTCLFNGQLKGYLTKDVCINGVLLSAKANKMAMVVHIGAETVSIPVYLFFLFYVYLGLPLKWTCIELKSASLWGPDRNSFVLIHRK